MFINTKNGFMRFKKLCKLRTAFSHGVSAGRVRIHGLTLVYDLSMQEWTNQRPSDLLAGVGSVQPEIEVARLQPWSGPARFFKKGSDRLSRGSVIISSGFLDEAIGTDVFF